MQHSFIKNVAIGIRAGRLIKCEFSRNTLINTNSTLPEMNSVPEQLRFVSIPGHTIRADFAEDGLSSGRGRDDSYPPPTQIRTCGTTHTAPARGIDVKLFAQIIFCRNIDYIWIRRTRARGANGMKAAVEKQEILTR